MSDKKHLGVEFYRNFVGIEKPLEVIEHEHDIRELEDINIIDDAWCINYCDLWDVKPYLRTIEDLNDEELLSIFETTKDKHTISRTKSYIFMINSMNKTIIAFSLVTSQFIDSHIVDEKFYSNMRELHCDPRAKEYIDNGLALRVER